jgi:SPP1 gp7 family putative phage head morphogenesis protein
LAANDRIADLFTDHALDLQRLAAGEARTVARFLRDLEADLVAQLARIDPTGAARASTRARRLAALLDQVRETIRQAYRQIGTTVRAELAELADIESGFVVRAINQGVGVAIATNSLTRNLAASLVQDLLVQGAPVSDWWSRQAGDTLAKFSDQMRLGIAEGETNAQLIRRVRGGMQNGAPVQGVMEISRRNAESLVRSATQAVAGRARQATFEQNADIMSAVQWRATLDTRTTLACASRDGLRYTVIDHEPIGHSLPWGGGPGNLHWGCRSTSAPVTKSWQELGFNVADLPAGTRASMDGQVAADTTFEGWLDRQSKTRQDTVLGAGRAELYRSGKISFRDLVDGNGRELSLEELRAKVAA